jgi:polysaccharide biosynthesis transport protein
MNSFYDQLYSMLYSIWRKRWYALTALWSVCLLGWGSVALVPNQFEATARIFVQPNRSIAILTGEPNNNAFRQVDTIKKTLVNRSNLEKVIRRTDLDLTVEDDSEMEKLINTLVENISLKSQGEDLFTVSYVSKDRKLSDQENANLSKRVVQNLINLFLEDNMKGDREQLNSVIRAVDEQLGDLKTRLEDAEKSKADFERANYGFLPGSGNFASRLDQARTELNQAEQRVSEASSARGALAANLASIPPTVEGNQTIFMMPGGDARADPGSTAGRIEVMERQVSQYFAQGLTESHPDVVIAKSQLTQLRQQLAIEQKTQKKAGLPSSPRVVNPLYTQVRFQLSQKDAELASARSSYARLTAEISELSGKTQSSPGLEADRAKINRDYDTIKSTYEDLLRKREKAYQNLKSETSTEPLTIRVIDSPEVPLKPVAPNRPLLISMVLAAGSLLGLAIAFVMSQAHTTYMDVNRLREAVNLQVLGSITSISSEQQRNQGKTWLLLFVGALAALLIVYAGLMVIEILRSATAL